MRSRPKVKMYYATKSTTPGQRFGAELVLDSRSETPIEFVDINLVGTERTTVGYGKSQYTEATEVLRLQAREDPKVLLPGEKRYKYTFDIPADAAPSYVGQRCSVNYVFSVHVSVPWWPDRRAHFVLPVTMPPATLPLGGEARIVASSDGPQPGRVYAEVSIDRDVLEPGGTIAGAVSISNTVAHRVRRVVASLVATERIGVPRIEKAAALRYSAILVEGPPPEGEPIPFKLRVPDAAPATFKAFAFSLDWQLEVRADVAFSDDAVVVVPLMVMRTPAGTAPRPPGRYHPVGRDRFARVWAAVATKLNMALDEDGQTLRASSGQASLAIRRVYDGQAYALRVELGWPTLGIDLHVTERSWTDIVTNAWPGPSATAREKLLVRGREPEQLAALFDVSLLDVLARYTGVSIEDDHARMTLPIAGTSAPQLEQAARSALWLLSRFAQWPALVPPPRKMGAAVDAWRAFAEKAGGVLETGSLSAKSCAMGVDRFSVETHWLKTDSPMATVVTFPFDPPLEKEPTDDDPSLSPAARELLKTVKGQTSNLEITRERLSWREAGALGDPAVLLPRIEVSAGLIRALRGRATAGPFR